jgi:hypothetical protein
MFRFCYLKATEIVIVLIYQPSVWYERHHAVPKFGASLVYQTKVLFYFFVYSKNAFILYILGKLVFYIEIILYKKVVTISSAF